MWSRRDRKAPPRLCPASLRALRPALALAAAACGSADRPPPPQETSGQGGAPASDAAPPDGDAGLHFPGAGTDPDRVTEECFAEAHRGEPAPLDLYLMLDRSGSMLERTAAGATRWDAMAGAFVHFVDDPRSAGTGIGLQYFPLRKPGVPATCTAHADCGPDGGPCFLTACTASSTLRLCTTAAECPAGSCEVFGACEHQPASGPAQLCSPLGATCAGGLGECLDIPDRFCVGGTDCRAEAYARPAVPIAALPGSAGAVLESITETVPEGSTPTAPALRGAIAHAREHALIHPGRRVAVVLATDGLPTECLEPQPPGALRVDFAPFEAIAREGLLGSPSIPTFLIGVFSPGEEEAEEDLHGLARAGGTERALMVDADRNLTAEFLEAMNAVRGQVMSCDFLLPEEESGGRDLDFFRVNVEIASAPGERRDLVYVGEAGGCAAGEPGWHYDVDPASGASPARISVCPDVCEELRSTAGLEVSLRIGCRTIVR